MNLEFFQGNWIDFVIIIVLGFFVAEGYRTGLWASIANFLAFFGSVLLSFRAFKIVSYILRSNFSLPQSLANALGFFIVAIVLEAILSYILWLAVERVPLKLWKSRWNKLFGTLPSIGEGIVVIAFIITFVVGLPVGGSIKKDITESKIGGEILKNTSSVESRFEEIFGGVVRDTLTYLTIRPESRETVPLTVPSEDLRIDEVSESEMFISINRERKERGLDELYWRLELVSVALSHATDMWKRKYFSHYSPDGKSVGDRLKESDVGYVVAGENLALAPTLQAAHNGLMSSPGHRANILNTEFKRVGIGVVDNGVYGKMFVQVFTD